MRKTGSILVALLLLFGLTACGGPENEPESESVPKGDGQMTTEPAPSSREPAVSITETGDIYRAENGWSDSYSGERYQPVTEDEMYVRPISGYIE